MEGLSDRDREILAFESGWRRHVGDKQLAIWDAFGMKVPHYYSVLNRLIDTPAAVAAEPMLVKRLQRARDARTAARQARRFRTVDAPRLPHERDARSA